MELARGALFVALAVAFLVLAWMFLRLASIFSATEKTIKEVSDQVVPLLGKTHVTVDNINSQLSQLDEAVGDVADITGELDQTTAVITRGVRGGVIKVSSATAGLSKGISAFFGGAENQVKKREGTRIVEERTTVSEPSIPPKEGA
ncbi:MAG: Secreted protein [uncultured Rubrobacteraceae bacterium]|uniref:Secreted protein n=1 Tax=uncultured Rubrobacteraceae bacterium TaxID=349277 RepID=A0A6J4R094_9ACTN|nr:MAG: Secreted protein [uncultured Rubrobacteraceae bacterium]